MIIITYLQQLISSIEINISILQNQDLVKSKILIDEKISISDSPQYYNGNYMVVG